MLPHKMLHRVILLTALMCIFAYQHSLAVPTNSESGRIKRQEDTGCPGSVCQAEKGERGETGPQGPQGVPGIPGTPGFCDATSCSSIGRHPENEGIDTGLPDTGAKGEQGTEGEKGLKGEPGKDGLDGKIGPPGNAGAPGRKGVPGSPGDDGMKGMKGDPGMVGPAGEKGSAGESGRTGPPGKRGLPGTPGTPGIDGRDGIDGEKGQTGLGGPPVDVIPRIGTTCSEELQGVIRFDPNTKQLYFCDGTNWICIQTTECTGPAPTCPSPLGPQAIGDAWYQVFVRNITQDSQDAADIVLVIDESGSMTAEHEWLLVMIPLLEDLLVQNGVGDGTTRNRYCVIGFGSFGNLRPGHFRPVDGQPCFSAADFHRSQSQLIAAGLREDGYEAIQFALDNVPFRESPFIAKNVILITDEGRTVIPEGENITRAIIEAELKAKDILLNVVVFADYELEASPNKTVIGVDAMGTSLILEPNGVFSTSNDRVLITQAEKNTADAYVDLAISVGGAAWALRVLRESSINKNVEVQQSFTAALNQIKLREIQAIIESCRRCTCVVNGDSVSEECTVAEDEQFCRCVVDNEGDNSTCVPGLPDPDGGDERVSGGLVSPGQTITSIERAPDFVELDVIINNP